MRERRHGHGFHVVREHEVAALEGRVGPGELEERERPPRRGAERHAMVGAGSLHEVDDVTLGHPRHVDILQALLHGEQVRAREHGGDGHGIFPAAPAPGEDLHLLLGIRVAHGQAHQEAVELGFGQRIRAFQLDRVLGGDHEEWRLEGEALAFDGDLRLLHRLQQRALRLGRGPVDLVGEEQVGEDRTSAELEPRLALVVEEAARDVAGQEVGRELDALEAEIERLGDEPGDERLGEAGVVLDENVAVGEDTGQDLLEHVRLADDHLAERGEDLLAAVGHGVELHAPLSISVTRRASALIEGPRRRRPGPSGGRERSVPASAESRGQRILSKYRRLRMPWVTSSRSARKRASSAGAAAGGGGASRGEGGAASMALRARRSKRTHPAITIAAHARRTATGCHGGESAR